MKVKSDYYKTAINSSRWRGLRSQILREHPMCVDCAAEGFATFASEVHHITPVDNARTDKEKEKLMFDPSNLVPLCHACHVARHKVMGKQSTQYYKEHASKALDAAVSRYLSKED